MFFLNQKAQHFSIRRERAQPVLCGLAAEINQLGLQCRQPKILKLAHRHLSNNAVVILILKCLLHAGPFYTKARFRRQTFHVPNLMLMS